jgi:hypothetical protein
MVKTKLSCLGFIWEVIRFPFWLVYKGLLWAWKAVSHQGVPPQIIKIGAGALAVMGIFGACAVTGSLLPPVPTRTPTLTAMPTIPPTQTETFEPTDIPTVTITIPPTATQIRTIRPTDTRWPTATAGAPPANTGHPAGTSGQCRDGTYTESQNKRGACSHHDGISEWWGP